MGFIAAGISCGAERCIRSGPGNTRGGCAACSKHFSFWNGRWHELPSAAHTRTEVTSIHTHAHTRTHKRVRALVRPSVCNRSITVSVEGHVLRVADRCVTFFSRQDVEAAWEGWQRVGEKLWMYRGVPFSADAQNRLSLRSSSPPPSVFAETNDLFAQGDGQLDTRIGRSYDRAPKNDYTQNIQSKAAAIMRGWADLSNSELEAATRLGWNAASWIARDAAPLAALKLHGLTLPSAQKMRHIDKEQKQLLLRLGFSTTHKFSIFYVDADVPASLHETQVFVTVKHSDAHVSEPIVPQFEAIEGAESTFATRPPLSDSPRRSGTFWQQSYVPSTNRPEDSPRAALLRNGGRPDPS